MTKAQSKFLQANSQKYVTKIKINTKKTFCPAQKNMQILRIGRSQDLPCSGPNKCCLFCIPLKIKKLVAKKQSQAYAIKKTNQNLKSHLNSKLMETKYQNYSEVNVKRLQIQPFFDKIIFNSSINLQARYQDIKYVYTNLTPTLDELQGKLHFDLLDIIELSSQWNHQRSIDHSQLKYPQLLRLGSVAWELTDFVLFQIQMNVRSRLQTIQMNGQENQLQYFKNLKSSFRQLIHKQIKQMLSENVIITPHAIRQKLKIKQSILLKLSHQQDFNRQISDSLKSIKEYAEYLQKNALQSYIQKLPNINQKLKILFKIHSHEKNMLRSNNNQALPIELDSPDKKLQQNSLQIAVRQQVQNRLSEILYFFEANQSQLSIKNFTKKFNKIDKNVFIIFYNHQQLMRYVHQILSIVFKQFIVNQPDEQKKQIMKKFQRQKFNQYYKKYQNKELPLIFFLTRCKKIVAYVQQNIAQLINQKNKNK